MTMAVTAFVPIPGHPRSVDEYHVLGQQLLAGLGSRVMYAQGELERCWLYRHLSEHGGHYRSHSTADNPRKNSLAYHIVQAQKTELLEAVSYVIPDDVFVWIDYGILHVPGVTVDIIREFLQRTNDEQAVAIPGCWEKDERPYDDQQPCWRFCGGVMVVPRDYVEWLNLSMQREYMTWLEQTGNISWEVNTLARLEKKSKLPIWWYKADHDASMFVNYRATQCV